MDPLMPVWRLDLDGFGQFGGVQFFGLERECGAPQLSTIFLADQKCDTFAPLHLRAGSPTAGRGR